MSVTSNWSFIWKSIRTYTTKSQNDATINDLENPNSATNDRITFHFCSYSKLLSPSFLHITKLKLLKSYEKCFLFQLNSSFGSCNIQILEGNKEVENWNNYEITKWIAYITNFNFWKNSKTTLN